MSMTGNRVLRNLASGAATFSILTGIAMGIKPAKAAIIVVPTPIDETERLNITWEWDRVVGPGESTGIMNDPGLINWRLGLNIIPRLSPEEPPGVSGIFVIGAVHTATPHPIPDEMGPLFGTSLSASILNLEVTGPQTDSDRVPHGIHFDSYTATAFIHTNDNIRINLTAVHTTPEPSFTITFIILSAISVISTLKHKKFGNVIKFR